MENLKEFLNHEFIYSDAIKINIKSILFLIVILIAISILLKASKKLFVAKLEEQHKKKFDTVFSFASWFIYIVVFLTVLHSSGVKLSALFAASAALLIGVGLALQTFFQDILSGLFIISDKSVLVGDIIEIEGKIGRVQEIKLRTTRAVTIDNKVIVIPNHLYLTKCLYNWTQNGEITRESVTVGVAHGSDTVLVKRLLLQAAKEHPDVLTFPKTVVLFEEFGDSALKFKLVFPLKDSFNAIIPKSDIRFAIDKLFREHNVTIPFPQRDIHLKTKGF